MDVTEDANHAVKVSVKVANKMTEYMEMINKIAEQEEMIDHLKRYVRVLKRAVLDGVYVMFDPTDCELGLGLSDSSDDDTVS